MKLLIIILLFASVSVRAAFPFSLFKNSVTSSSGADTNANLPLPAFHYAFENTGEDSSGNNRHVFLTFPQTSVKSLAIVDDGTLYVTDENNVATTGGTGSGLTVNYQGNGVDITAVQINQPGTGYTTGDIVTIDIYTQDATLSLGVYEGGYTNTGLITNGGFNPVPGDNKFNTNSFDLATTNFSLSVCFFFKMTNAGTGTMIYSDNDSIYFVGAQHFSGDSVIWLFGDGSVTWTNTPMAMDVWHTCCAGYNATTGFIWTSTNGAAKVTNEIQANFAVSGTYDFNVMDSSDGGQPINGIIDGVTWWTNTELSNIQITNFHNAVIGQPPGGRTFYGGAWH